MKLEEKVYPDFYQRYPWVPQEDTDDFIGRQLELEDFWNQLYALAKKGRMARKNTAYIGQRKLGKTAFLTRCYNTAFWQQQEIIPFYYCFSQMEEMDIEEVAEEIASLLLRQAAAFLTKEQKFFEMPEEAVLGMLREEALRNDEQNLLYGFDEQKSTWHRDLVLFWQHNQKRRQECAKSSLLHHVWNLVNSFSLVFRKKCVLIIDEAQQMECALYYDKKLIPCKNSIGPIINMPHILTIISGSQVSMLARKFLQLPLGNRISPYGFTPLEEQDAHHLVRLCIGDRGYPDIERDVYNLVGGNPYYIKTLFAVNSKYNKYQGVPKRFDDEQGLQDAYDFEVLHPDGEIYQFWQIHFAENADLLNHDPQKGLTFRVLKYIAEEQRTISYQEIDEKFQLEDVEGKMDQLRRADLIDNPPFLQEVHGLQDRVLAVVITRIHYKTILDDPTPMGLKREIERLLAPDRQRIEKLEKDHEEAHKKLQEMQQNLAKLDTVQQTVGRCNVRKGAKAEGKMRKRVREAIEHNKGLFANYDLAGTVSSIIVSTTDGKGRQLDLFAQLQPHSANGKKTPKIGLAAEVRERKSKVTAPQVRKFLGAMALAECSNDLQGMIGVMISKSGFTKPAEELLKQHKILHGTSDRFLYKM